MDRFEDANDTTMKRLVEEKIEWGRGWMRRNGWTVEENELCDDGIHFGEDYQRELETYEAAWGRHNKIVDQGDPMM